MAKKGVAKAPAATPAAAPEAVNVEKLQRIIDSVGPTQSLSREEYFRLLLMWPEADASAYWYRTWPVIDRRKAGERYKNIDVWAVQPGEDLAEDRLLRLFGSGRYMGKLSCSNRPGKQTQVATATFSIEDPDWPPVIPVEELLLEHPDNRSYVQGLRAAGLLPNEGGAVANNGAVAEALHFAKDVMAKNDKAGAAESGVLAALIQQQGNLLSALVNKPSGDSDTTKLMLGMLSQQTEMYKALAKPQASSSDQLVAILMKQQGDILTALLTARGTGGGEDELAKLDRYLQIAERIGGGNGGVIGEFVRTLPEIVQGAAALIGNIAAVKAGGPPLVTSVPEDDDQPDLLSEPGAGAGDPPPPTENPSEEQPMSLLDQFASVGDKAVKAFNAGIPGSKFADGLKMMEPEIFANLQTMGKGGVLASLKMQPAVWKKIKPHEAKLSAWLDDFFTVS